METEGGSQLFETAEKGGVVKNAPLKGEGHASSLFCEKKHLGEIGESSDQLSESESDSA